MNFQRSTHNLQPILFSYSYTALELFRFAKARGWETVLGQIDGGLVEAQLVQRVHSSHPDSGSTWSQAHPVYWEAWKEELRLADHVVVNSQWSQKCLVESGFVGQERITVLPLAYNPPFDSVGFLRSYPAAFSAVRPMKVLFLGQVNVRKGVPEVFDAIRLLTDLPIDFTFIGPVMVNVPADLRVNAQVHFAGVVPRSDVARYYRAADVFLFPTHSDGFGLTQLEAQAWKLPIVASRFCGEVAQDGRNGIILTDVSAAAICDALRNCCLDPKRLTAFSAKSVSMRDYGISRLSERLQALIEDLQQDTAP